MKFGPRTFSEETDLAEPLSTYGPVTTSSNLSVPSMKVNGPVTIGGTLDVFEGSLSINGPVTITGDLITTDDSKINGPCEVKGAIFSSFIKIRSSLKAGSLDGRVFWLPSKVNVKNDIIASESITFNVGSRPKISVGGIIEAPEITFKKSFRFNLLRKGMNLLALRKRQKSDVIISDLNVKADRLYLNGVEIEGNAEVGEIIYLE